MKRVMIVYSWNTCERSVRMIDVDMDNLKISILNFLKQDDVSQDGDVITFNVYDDGKFLISGVYDDYFSAEWSDKEHPISV